MEEKILKTSVYVNDTVFNETAEQAIDVDFTLPDYCPDISKILKCRAVSHISSKSMSGKNITVDGSVSITVLYCDADGRLCSYEYQYPFSKNLEMREECASACLTARSKCEYINCRAVTGRKIDIHGAIVLFVKVLKRKCTDIISDIDNCSIEQRRGIAPATIPMGSAEKYLMIEEDIIIGQGQPPIERVLRYDAKPFIKESKIINDKVVVKGDMAVRIMYCPKDGGIPQTVKTVVPFSQIIDMEGIGELCECEAKSDIAFLEVKLKNSDIECKSLSLTAKLLVTAEAFCANEIPVILDAFSRKHFADIENNKICFKNICQKINESFHCKQNIETPEPITSVSDIWCDVHSVSTRFEEGFMKICGTVVASLITCDVDGVAAYFEKPIDFEYKYLISSTCECLNCAPEIEIASCSYTIISANTIEIRIDLCVNAAIYECRDMLLITNIEIDEKRIAERPQKCAMTVYFTGENEHVWDIAKLYNASVEELMKINELAEESLPENKMILIPAL